jgi:anthranilate synthase/aminodeoxychorismate synthase-like glutamine amidotransferase
MASPYPTLFTPSPTARRASILLVDCFDSFSWNVAGLLRELGARTDVVRSDADLAGAVIEAAPDLIVLSPGPGRPADYPAIRALVDRQLGRTPLLGICLGMQAIAEVAGGATIRAPKPLHGKTSRIRHDDGPEFHGVPRTFTAMRYHSLCMDEPSLPDGLTVAARADDGVIMALRHACAFGVQFHPESFLTNHGGRILANVLAGARAG